MNESTSFRKSLTLVLYRLRSTLFKSQAFITQQVANRGIAIGNSKKNKSIMIIPIATHVLLILNALRKIITNGSISSNNMRRSRKKFWCSIVAITVKTIEGIIPK